MNKEIIDKIMSTFGNRILGMVELSGDLIIGTSDMDNITIESVGQKTEEQIINEIQELLDNKQ